jgi:hypothetical protein
MRRNPPLLNHQAKAVVGIMEKLKLPCSHHKQAIKVALYKIKSSKIFDLRTLGIIQKAPVLSMLMPLLLILGLPIRIMGS